MYFRSADVPLGSHSVQAQELLPSQLPTLCQWLASQSAQTSSPPQQKPNGGVQGHQSAGRLNYIGSSFDTK